ncbi:hypothetical protein MTR67_011871, partial [Solanum verrucosum]
MILFNLSNISFSFFFNLFRVRLPGTTLRVPEEDPNPWPSKLPRQLEAVLGGSGSASRTCSTNGEQVAPRHGDTA